MKWLAGLEIGWLLGGCVGILLVTAMIIVIGHIWRKRRECGTETLANGELGNSPWNGSVLFAAPETLKKRNLSLHDIHTNIDEDDENTEIDPLAPAVVSDHRI
ncbi:unnamed protein product [Colias eurytheme]|nr:unnamed protein product [Colias eurytheme]